MKININEEEVRHILKMHSKEREKTFLLKEDNNSDIEKLRIAIASGCVNKGGNLYTRADNGRVIYRVKSAAQPTKEIDFSSSEMQLDLFSRAPKIWNFSKNSKKKRRQ